MCWRDRGDVLAEPLVRIETVDLTGPGNRQIGPKNRTTALLRDRHDDIEAAVSEAAGVLRESVSKLAVETDGWRVKSVEAKFGLTLTAEAGVVLTRASAEASFEVTIAVERG